MKRHSKAIAAVIGAIGSILMAEGLLPMELATPEVKSALITAATALVVWIAPANS